MFLDLAKFSIVLLALALLPPTRSLLSALNTFETKLDDLVNLTLR